MIENAPFTAGDVISKDNIKYKIISIQVISESRKFSKFIYVIEQINSKHKTYIDLLEIKNYRNISDIRDENINDLLS